MGKKTHRVVVNISGGKAYWYLSAKDKKLEGSTYFLPFDSNFAPVVNVNCQFVLRMLQFQNLNNTNNNSVIISQFE